MFQSLQEGIESVEGGGHPTGKERLVRGVIMAISAVIVFGGLYLALLAFE